MLLLTAVLLFPLLFIYGKAALDILYGKQNDFAESIHWEDCLLTGGILFIGLAEGAHLGALVRGQSVSVAQKYFFLLHSVAVVFCGAFLLIRLLWKGKRNAGNGVGRREGIGEISKKLSKKELFLLAGVALIFMLQAMGLLFGTAVYQEQDQTLESVVTFLKEDRLYGSNPLTGMPYIQGMPSRLKILCLPTLYAVLCKSTQADPEWLVWHVIPVITLLLAYLAYYSLARSLFPGKREQILAFMLCVAMLFWVGDAMYGLEGFGLMHGGFFGTTIRGAVLMPYLIGCCLRKKWGLCLGVILAEACLVWTLYGAGMGLLIVLAFVLIPVARCFFPKGKVLTERRNDDVGTP